MTAIGEADRGRQVTGAWSSALEVRQLRALVALVDSGSMTAAARELGVSQSTVSEAIAALERGLGTAAVVRRSGARGVLLTAAGEALLPHARRALGAVEEARAAAVAASREARSSVEVIANESLSTYLLPRALLVLRESWPNARFAVSVGTCDAVRAGVAGGRFDVGLSFETEPERRQGEAAAGDRSRALAITLARLPLAVFCGSGHPLLTAAPRQVDRALLAPYTVFTSDASGDFHAFLGRFFAAAGRGPRLEAVGSVEAVKRSVQTNGLALGVLPAYAIADERRKGSLHALPVHPKPPRIRLEAKLSRARPESPAAADLVEVLRGLVDRAVGRRTQRR